MTEKTGGPAGACETQKTRRSGRIKREVPILLIGSDSDGIVFSEETNTVVLSWHGAGIVSKHKLMAEQELVLQDVSTGREAEVRVVGEIAQQEGTHTYGVSFLEETVDFWQMEFPAAPEWDERPLALMLECGACKGVVELENGDYEYDICTIHGGLERYCEECGLTTVWRRSSVPMPTGRRVGAKKRETPHPPVAVEVAEEEEPKEVQAEVVAVADAMEGVDRRCRVRAV